MAINFKVQKIWNVLRAELTFIFCKSSGNYTEYDINDW